MHLGGILVIVTFTHKFSIFLPLFAIYKFLSLRSYYLIFIVTSMMEKNLFKFSKVEAGCGTQLFSVSKPLCFDMVLWNRNL